MTASPRFSQQLLAGREVLAATPPTDAEHAPPILFVHGAFCSASLWADTFLPWFAAAGHPAWALSLRGHGGSAERARIDWLSIADYVEDVAIVAAALTREWGEAPILVGHSMGGFVVQKYLERHPAPAAVLLCAVPPQGLAAAQFHLLLQKPHLFFELNRILGGEHVGLETVREALFAQPVEKPLLAKLRAQMQPESHRAIWDMSGFTPPALARRPHPPLFIAGAECDVLVPAFLVQATARTYGQNAHIFKGLGHAVMLERDWPQVAATLAAWLADQGLSPVTGFTPADRRSAPDVVDCSQPAASARPPEAAPPTRPAA